MVASEARYLGDEGIKAISEVLAKFDSDHLIDTSQVSESDFEAFRTVIKTLYRVTEYSDSFMVEFVLDTIINHVTAVADDEVRATVRVFIEEAVKLIV